MCLKALDYVYLVIQFVIFLSKSFCIFLKFTMSDISVTKLAAGRLASSAIRCSTIVSVYCSDVNKARTLKARPRLQSQGQGHPGWE